MCSLFLRDGHNTTFKVDNFLKNSVAPTQYQGNTLLFFIVVVVKVLGLLNIVIAKIRFKQTVHYQKLKGQNI